MELNEKVSDTKKNSNNDFENKPSLILIIHEFKISYFQLST